MKSHLLFYWLPGGLVEGLVASLVDTAVKGGLLLLLAAAMVCLLPRSSAATRHVVWTAALVCALAMPILSFCLPHWHVLPSWMTPSVRIEAPLPLSLDSFSPPNSLEEPTSLEMPGRSMPPAARSQTPLPAPDRISRLAMFSRFFWPSVVLLVWSLGVLTMLVPPLRSAISLRRLVHRARPIDCALLAGALPRVTRELGLRRAVTIFADSVDSMPMVWGIWRAYVLLPASATEWTPTRLQAVLLHELAHVLRRDPLTLLFGQIARAIHWFNPLVWWALDRLRCEQEQACDDCVLRAGIRASDYASHVLEFATGLRAPSKHISIALSMATPATLENRLRAIVLGAANRTAVPGWFITVASIASMILACPLAMVRAVDKSDHRHQKVSFEPTTVMLLPSATGSSRFLDLMDGKSCRTIAAEKPVAYINREKDDWYLIVENIYNYPTENGVKVWDAMSAEQIAEPAGLAAVPFERKGFYDLRKDHLPITVLIPQWGLLQVTATDWRNAEWPSVIIQSKRIKTGQKADAMEGNGRRRGGR